MRSSPAPSRRATSVLCKACSAWGKDHGRVRRWLQHVLCLERKDAHPRPRACCRCSPRISKKHRRRRPASTAEGIGNSSNRILTAESVTQAYAVQARDAGGRVITIDPTIRSSTTATGTVFTGSQYDPKTREWKMSKLPVHRNRARVRVAEELSSSMPPRVALGRSASPPRHRSRGPSAAPRRSYPLVTSPIDWQPPYQAYQVFAIARVR